MAKKKIIYQETYNKGTIATNMQQIIDMIKADDTIMFVNKAGEYDDGREFVTITFEFKKRKK
jgi:hypothetical protein